MSSGIDTFPQVELYTSDIKLCKAPHYLNDNLIGFAFKYLENVMFPKTDFLFVHPGGAFVISHEDDPEDLLDTVNGIGISTEKKLIFFPVNDGGNTSMQFTTSSQGSHWALLVYDSEQRKFFYYDSSGSSNRIPALRLARQLNAVLPCGAPQKNEDSNQTATSSEARVMVVKSSAPIVVESKCPQQTNGYDCGLYAIAVARALAEAQLKSMKVGSSSSTEHLGKVVKPQTASQLRDDIPKWIKATAKNKKPKS
uniref:Ubiquitin-like protease family profile domain-containing protein n=1 Tax=Lotharella oceanica TaxID=641309 RepID=A0A7S2U1H3_9EUKA